MDKINYPRLKSALKAARDAGKWADDVVFRMAEEFTTRLDSPVRPVKNPDGAVAINIAGVHILLRAEHDWNSLIADGKVVAYLVTGPKPEQQIKLKAGFLFEKGNGPAGGSGEQGFGSSREAVDAVIIFIEEVFQRCIDNGAVLVASASVEPVPVVPKVFGA